MKFRLAFAVVASAFSTGALLAANLPTLTDTLTALPGPPCYTPRHIVVDSVAKRVYVGGSSPGFGANGGVSVIDPESNQVLKNLTLKYEIEAVAADPVRKHAYFATFGSPDGRTLESTIAVLDGDTNTFVAESNTAFATQMVADPVTGRLFTNEGSFNPSKVPVYAFDGSAVTKVGEVQLTDGNAFYRSSFMTAANGKVYVAASANDVAAIGIIDAATLSITFVPTNATSVNSIVVDQAVNRVYAFAVVPSGNGGSKPAVLVISGGSVTQTIDVAADAFPDPLSGAAVDPVRHRAYFSVTSFPAPRSEVIDTANNQAAGELARSFSEADVLNTTGTIYAASFGNGNPGFAAANAIGAIDPATAAATMITTGYKPYDFAFNSHTGRVYVADQQANDLLVLDAAAPHQVLARVPIGASDRSRISNDEGASDVAVSEGLDRVYTARNVLVDPAAGRSASVFDIIDGTSNAVLTTITVSDGDFYHGYIAVDDSRRRLYITAGLFDENGAPQGFAVCVYDMNDNSRIATIPVSSWARDLAVNPVTGRVYVSLGNTGYGSFAILDGPNNTVLKSYDAGQFPAAVPGPIQIDSARNKIYVANLGGSSDNSVTVLNGDTDDVDTTFKNTTQNNGDGVSGVAVDPVSNTVYVADDSDQFDATGRLTVFDPAAGYSFLGQIELGRYPERMAFNNATRDLYVTNTAAGAINILHDNTARPPDLLGNISTRVRVGSGDNVLIGGFIVTGPGGSTKTVMLRAIGPSLTDAGVAGALSDTVLELHDSAGNVIVNDDWKNGGTNNGQPYASDQSRIAATGIAPTKDKESAIIATVAPGPITAIVSGKGGASGIAVVEVYDLDQSSAAQLANISTRGNVENGDNAMIGGLIVLGSTPQRVIVRAIGPSLTSSIPAALQDPTLDVVDANGQSIESNDNWQTRPDSSSQQAEVEATTVQPTDPRESAVVTTLYPGNYTAVVRGAGNSIGVAVVEAYNLH